MDMVAFLFCIFILDLKNIKTMIYWIDHGPPVTRVMDSIKFNNFFS
jgi:hypothetical protein